MERLGNLVKQLTGATECLVEMLDDRAGYRVCFLRDGIWREIEVDFESAAQGVDEPQWHALLKGQLDVARPTNGVYSPEALYSTLRQEIVSIAQALSPKARKLFNEEMGRRCYTPEERKAGCFPIRDLAHHRRLLDGMRESLRVAMLITNGIATTEPALQPLPPRAPERIVSPPPASKTRIPNWWIFPWPCPAKYLE